jgi:uncharacterized damage-inducible protein DinB
MSQQTEIDRILDEIDREYQGDPWHGSPLGDILRDVSAEQAAARPMAHAHSIWEIVVHMTAWKNEVRKRLSGRPAGLPEEGDWPAVGSRTEARWAEALSQLDKAHLALVESVRALQENRLFEPTNDPRDRANGTGVSYYVLLHGIVQHDVYHAGQIAVLKKGV